VNTASKISATDDYESIITEELIIKDLVPRSFFNDKLTATKELVDGVNDKILTQNRVIWHCHIS